MRIIGLTRASVAAGALAAAAMIWGCSPAPQPTAETPVESAAAPAAEAASETIQEAAAVEPAPESVAASNPPPAPVVRRVDPPAVAPAPVPARRDPAPAATPPAAPPARPVVQASAGLPSGAGRDLTQRTCTGCHGVDAITAQGRTPEGWAQVINQMQNMGLSAGEEDLVQIHAYLSRNLPPR